MNYFIDTNIALAYSFSCDKFHDESFNFINQHSNNIYWSNNVKNEFDEKFEKIYTDIETFMTQMQNALHANTDTYFDYNTFERYVIENTKNCKLDNIKKIRILEFFWNNSEIFYLDSSDEMRFKLISFIINYLVNYDYLRHNLEEIIKLYDCHITNYTYYPDILNKLIDKNVHFPDYAIILDAYDFSFGNTVTFVTNDLKFLSAIKTLKEFEYLSFKSCN